MITIAVTGGIGAGKSTVSAALRDRGAVVVDSDQLAREVVAPGTPGLSAVAEAFGPTVIGADGALDRSALAAVVFADAAARRRLEGITHPLVRAKFEARRGSAPNDAIVVNDIPLLTTLEVSASYHLVIGVVADAESRIRRLLARGLSEADARARMASQLTDDQRAALCDVTVHNHGDVGALVAAVDDLWEHRLLPFEANTRAGRRADRGAPALIAPSATWQVQARRLAARASTAAGGARVDHIGSTAIPGMPAEDVIDLQLTVPDLAAADRLAPGLTAIGFPPAAGCDQDTLHGGNPDGGDDDPGRWRTRVHANADPGQSVNLYLRVRGSPNWRWALLFRDWLTAEPSVAAEYLTVKRQAAAAQAADRTVDGYALAKEPWLHSAYPRGLAWAAGTGWSPH